MAASTARPGRTSTRGNRRDELVRAAFGRIAVDGLEGLRLRQVADAVGIDHSTLHHHVATKQDLVEGVVEYATRQFHTTMPADPDPVVQLRGHLDALGTLMADRPELFTVTAELDLRARRDPAVRESLDRFEAGWRHALTALLTRGADAGSWTPAVDLASTAEMIIATVKGVRLVPQVADTVFAQLVSMLTGRQE